MTFGQRLTGGKCFKWWETYKAEETAKEKMPKKQLEVCVWRVKQEMEGGKDRGKEREKEIGEWNHKIRGFARLWGAL